MLMTWTLLWLSLLCVGGGAESIPEMQRQVVDQPSVGDRATNS